MYTLRRVDEVRQHVELHPGQVDFSVTDPDNALVAVEQQVAMGRSTLPGGRSIGFLAVPDHGQRRPAGCRQACLQPRLEAADHVGGATYPQLLQRIRRQARGVSLRAEHEDLQIVRRLGQPGVADRVEPPFQDVAFNDQGPRDLALRAALGGGPDVDQSRARPPRGMGGNGVEPLESCARQVEQVDDGQDRCGAHQSAPERSRETT